MARGRKAYGPKTTFDKVKALDPTFADEVYSYTEEQIKAKLLALAQDSAQMEEAKEQDADFKTLAEQYGFAKKTYTEFFKANKLRSKLMLQILTERAKA